MLDQEDAALAVDHHGARAQRGAARKAPIEMHQRPDRRVKRAADGLQKSSQSRVPSSLSAMRPAAGRKEM
jgi:hypothetical protein